MYKPAETTDVGRVTPPWRLPESEDKSFDLCDICCRIDFAWLVSNSLASLNSEFSQIELGSFEEISRKKDCAFCRLVVHTVEHALSIDNPAGPVQSCTLFNETLHNGQDSNVYVIKIWPVKAEPYWNESHLEDRRGLVRFLSTGIQQIGNTSSNEFGDHFGLKVDPANLNVEMVKSWLRICQIEHHQGARDPYPHMSPPSILRLIDVRRECLVQAPSTTDYIALSYVWGSTEPFRTLKSNVANLTAPQGLANSVEILPKTIKDAMELVRSLGLDYLWVDALCIVQDDDEEMANQIEAMGWVYNTAVLTLVAASGSDADAGLAGISPDTRLSRQRIERIRGVDYVNLLPSLQHTLEYSSKWSTRAWTYQEHILSRRLLVITEYQAYFSCGHAAFSEDNGGGIPAPGTSGLVGAHYHHAGKEDNYILYKTFVEKFTQRNITYGKDLMKAFAGISKIFEHRFRSTLCYGIPQTALDFLLLWQPDDNQHRRTYQEGGVSYLQFPSWSWAGWTGKVAYTFVFPFENNRPRMLWANPGAWEGYRISPTEVEANNYSRVEGWKRWEKRVDTAGFAPWTYYVEEDKPDVRFSFPILPVPSIGRCPMEEGSKSDFLRFRTLVATFYLRRGDIEERQKSDDHVHSTVLSHQGYSLDIYNSKQQVVGYVTVPRSATDGLGAWHDFIVLSRTTLTDDIRNELYKRDIQHPPPIRDYREDIPSEDRSPYHLTADEADMKPDFDCRVFDMHKPWPLYWVMLIEGVQYNVEGVQHNIAFRKGLGKIHIDGFWREGAAEKNIILG